VKPRSVGWAIVGWSTLVIGALCIAILAVMGTGEAGVRAVIRLTARTSFVLFTAAFTASALHRIRRSVATRWLRDNRRYLGVSFAVSHLLHLIAILELRRIDPTFEITATTIAFGGLAYVFIAAMAATSFDRTAAWLGPRRWRRLHTAGVYYIWGIFALSYLPRAVGSMAYAPVAVVVVAALVLRLHAARRDRVARSYPGVVTATD
jgi:DMSO/TMAO reductase YedYZ heme-binding membrane subunit